MVVLLISVLLLLMVVMVLLMMVVVVLDVLVIDQLLVVRTKITTSHSKHRAPGPAAATATLATTRRNAANQFHKRLQTAIF